MLGRASIMTFATKIKTGCISHAPKSQSSRRQRAIQMNNLDDYLPGAFTQAAFSLTPTPRRSTTPSGSSPPTSVTVTRLELRALPLPFDAPRCPALGDESEVKLGLLLSSPDVTFCIAFEDNDRDTDRTWRFLLGEAIWLDCADC
jgi:hypothetical protein